MRQVLCVSGDQDANQNGVKMVFQRLTAAICRLGYENDATYAC